MAYQTGVYCKQHKSATGYPLLSNIFSVSVDNVNVHTKLVQTYQAQTSVQRDIVYLFEVPPEAAVIGFTAQVGSVNIDAVIKSKEDANKIYQDERNADRAAFKLDQITNETFQISLGKVNANEDIVVSVTYVQTIASGTLEDTLRLNIPITYGVQKYGMPPDRTLGIATPQTPSNKNAIEVAIAVNMLDDVYNLASPTHTIDTPLYGFDDPAALKYTPAQIKERKDDKKAYVHWASKTFSDKNLVVTWGTPKVEKPYCLLQQITGKSGDDATYAFELSMVSPVWLEKVPNTEFLFLVDYSGSMSGKNNAIAREAFNSMIDELPKIETSFNVYQFTTGVQSVMGQSQSIVFDDSSKAKAKAALGKSPSGGTDINKAIETVIAQRNSKAPRCNVVILTDGFDWGVTKAIATITKASEAAATAPGGPTLLRFFVFGIGDKVSREMCESIARVGMGGTAYASDLATDEVQHKAERLIMTAGKAPVKVLRVVWPFNEKPVQQSGSANPGGSTIWTGPGAPPENFEGLGSAPKGQNLPPPDAIQNVPRPGVMFWSIRSTWYAICRGAPPPEPPKPQTLKARVIYVVPGVSAKPETLEVDVTLRKPGTLLHLLAARALIQEADDELTKVTDSVERYKLEAKITRWGLEYGLASSQTSFVATLRGVGTKISTIDPTKPFTGTETGAFHGINPDLGFFQVEPKDNNALPKAFSASSFPMQKLMVSDNSSMRLATEIQSASFDALHASTELELELEASTASQQPSPAPANDGKPTVNTFLSLQSTQGGFPTSEIARIAFPGSGLPALPIFISSLNGSADLKAEMWAALLVVAVVKNRFPGEVAQWSDLETKALGFVRTTLECCFGLTAADIENRLTNALQEAEYNAY